MRRRRTNTNAKHYAFHAKAIIYILLKLVSVIFCQVFTFSPNDGPSKTMKDVFLFYLKSYVLKIFKFL